MKHYNCSKKNSYIKNFYNNELYIIRRFVFGVLKLKNIHKL